MNSADFLLEIGVEELPPKALSKLATALLTHVQQGLDEASLSYEAIRWLAAPRRLALFIDQLAGQQADKAVEKRGPALKAAFDDKGKPTKALQGFMKSCGIKEAKQLETLETKQGSWLIHRFEQKGKPSTELLPDIIEKAVSKLPIPKPMRWGNSEAAFVRPAHWLVALLGDQVVPMTLFDLHADRQTYGHRFHAPQAIKLSHASDYESVLEERGYVIPCFDKRKQAIQTGIEKVAKKLSGSAVVSDALLNEVTGLVEWPVVLSAKFDKDFLQVPKEALMSAMQTHQKCFPVVTNSGALQPHFILVSNLESKNADIVVEGNVRVMRARLSDASFFFKTDCEQGLENFLPRLRGIIFHNQLGTVYEKSQRVSNLARQIAKLLKADPDDAARAGLLAKCDLASDMVGEFPELQGTMGKYYALAAKEKKDVALSLEEQYLPRFSGDNLPSSSLGCAVALADRLDTLVGIFGINKQPTGDKDPFALRRAALGLARIIIENKIELDFASLVKQTLQGFSAQDLPNKTVIEQVQQFVYGRLKAWYADQGYGANIFAAVYARCPASLYDFHLRLLAVDEFTRHPSAEALAAANKRVKNILEKEKVPEAELVINDELFEHDAERTLLAMISSKEKKVDPLYAANSYARALTELANLQAPIDTFFDSVMVMADDKAIRMNRLALLLKLRRIFLTVADISLLPDVSKHDE